MNAKVFKHTMAVILIPIIVVISVTLVLVGVSRASDSTRRIENDATLQILDTSANKILLVFELPEISLEHDVVDGKDCQRISVEGFAVTDHPGQAQIPILGTTLGIPQNAIPKIVILESEINETRIQLPICPAPKPVVDIDVDGNFTDSRVQEYWDLEFYKSSTNPNMPYVEIVETGNIRSQRVAQLRFQPIQYDPINNKLTVAKHLLVELQLGTTEEGSAHSDITIEEGAFESTLKALLLNYEAARKWRVEPESKISLRTEGEPIESNPFYKIMLDQDGIYELTYSELNLAGIPVASLNPRTFQLFNQNQEVAIYVTGNDPDTFVSGEAILFYGEKINTKFTDTNVYWLTWGIENGLRMDEVNGTPGIGTTDDYFLRTTHLEEDHNYQSSRPSGPDFDHWYWGYVYSSSSTEAMTVTTQLDHIANPAPDIVVRGLLRSFSGEPQHRSRIYLNGHPIDDETWLNGDEYSFETPPIPQSFP